MEYKDNGRVTQKGESSRDQEEDVKTERGKGTGCRDTRMVSERERDQRWQGQGDRVERRARGRERSETWEKGEEETGNEKEQGGRKEGEVRERKSGDRH